MTEAGARHNVDEHSHIFSPSGLLDDSWWHRSYPLWVKAMFVTQYEVVIAGPRDLYDEETAVASFTQNDKRFSLQQEHMIRDRTGSSRLNAGVDGSPRGKADW